jgi:DNA-binding IscR family transcriptional regulator
LTVILSEMAREGIVISQRGRDGGYELALPPVDIRYGDIIRLLSRQSGVGSLCQPQRA